MILSAAPAILPGTILERSQSLFGLFALILICYVIGKAYGSRKFPTRVVIWGIILQFAFGALVLFSPKMLATVQAGIQNLLAYSDSGARLLFGSLVDWATQARDSNGQEVGSVVLAASFAFSVLASCWDTSLS